VRLKQTSQ